MTTLTEQAKSRLATLLASFDELEEVLEPLFAQTLPETIVGLEPIQQAKLQTVLPYLVYDLVFIYLKSRGTDPKTHPVVSELVSNAKPTAVRCPFPTQKVLSQERVKQYFGKISAVENPPQKRTELDKDAAQRFIKHAITQATYAKPPAEETPGPSSTVQVQTRFTSKMLKRQLYEKKLKEQDTQGIEEEELEVFDGDDKMNVDTPTPVPSTIDDSKPKSSNKRRRPAVDPFAGYGDDMHASTPTPCDTSTSNTQQSKKWSIDVSLTDSAVSTPVPDAETSSGSTKKAKKAKKKKHRKSPT